MTLSEKITPAWVRDAKKRGVPVPVLTCYDNPTARLLDEAGLPVLLVGDSLGMVVLGYPDTTFVTMETMLHHVGAVARARPKALIVADLPFKSYDTADQALANSRRLIDAGADAVKLEGGRKRTEQIAAIAAAGIPVMGHLGMLPQSVREEGGYRIKGRKPEEREQLLADALALEQNGNFAIVLELVVPEVAAEITRAISVPTIGIGSGPDCFGQVLVTPDLMGTYPWFKPKFVKSTLDLATPMRDAARAFCREVETRS